MHFFTSILTIFSLLSISAGIPLCGLAGHEDCCCQPKEVVQVQTGGHGCCSETQPETDAPKSTDACSCAYEPMDEEVPSTFTLPVPEKEEFAADIITVCDFNSAIGMSPSLHKFQGPLHQTTPPGRRVPLYDLNASFRL